MKPAQLLIVIIVSAIIAVAAVKLMPQAHVAASASEQPAFDRVTSTRTLHCGYFIWAPYLMLDPNTKKMTGFAYEIFEQVGKVLGVKVEWTEEVPMSQLADNLKTGRNDVICNTVWPSGNRAASLDFAQPIDYIGAYAFVRADDSRFDGDLSKLNDPNVTASVIEGDYTKAIADEDFPNAKQYSLAMDSDGAQLLLAVTTKKADVAFVDPFLAFDFAKNNPGTIKRVPGVTAARVFGDSYVVAKGETRLRDMLNVALQQLNQSGFIRQTLDKYLGEHKGLYFYPAKPYEQ